MDEGDVLTDAEQASLAVVRTWRDQVNATAGQCDSPRINELLVQELEQLKFAISARQIELTAHAVEAATARLAGQVKNPGAVARRVTARAIALGRRRHPTTGARLVHQALALTETMPEVLAAMRAGHLGETQGAIMVRETDDLTDAQRSRVAEEVRPRWSLLGDTELAEAAKAAAARIAPDEIAARHRKAIADRYVSFGSAPNSMLRLTALLPLKDGMACAQALQTAADALLAAEKKNGSDSAAPAASDPEATADTADAGDATDTGETAAAGDTTTAASETAPRPFTGPPRQRWRQAQADALTARLTGTVPADLDQIPVAVNVNLMLPLDTLTGDGAAHLEGYGIVNGDVARDLIEACPEDAGPAIRRLFTHPETGRLVGMESRSRTYNGLLRQFITLRDQRCRTPWCGSRIKHIDHIRPAHAGGKTTAGNGQGGCERCNYDKELPGYTVTGTAERTTHTIGLISVDSVPPDPPHRVLIAPPPQPSRTTSRRAASTTRRTADRHHLCPERTGPPQRAPSP